MGKSELIKSRYYYKEPEIDYHINSKADIKKWFNEGGPPITIKAHPGFELVKDPSDGLTKKLAYNTLYFAKTEDLEIEFDQIKKYEEMQYYLKKEIEKLPRDNKGEREQYRKKRDEALDAHDEIKENLKFHYKKAISILAPKYAQGWNRWSEDILELFIDQRMHKVLWGSGNCGKSAVTGLLLYTKWRVNPRGRMIVLAAKTLSESAERVAGYIKEIHLDSPKSSVHRFAINPSSVQNKGIYCMIKDKQSSKLVPGDRSCIVHLPVKVNKKVIDDLSNIVVSSGGEELDDRLFMADIGGNLIGKHPDDRLILAFDEAQEIPGIILRSKIFSNWYTNEKLDVYAWGNPGVVNISAPEEHDLLYCLGTSKLTYNDVRDIENKATETGWWWWDDTKVLHLTMLDSPKDDQDEVDWSSFVGKERLTFLAGESNVERISSRTKKDSPSWYAQVLGFPYLIDTAQNNSGVMYPSMVKLAREYPLIWVDENRCQFFMGVDPSISGNYDKASIVIVKMGLMTDGRMGVDVLGGRFSENIEPVEGEEFSDTAVNRVYSLCETHDIPLNNVAIEAHATGEVFRYALQKHIESGDKPRWSKEYSQGLKYFIVNPMQSPTERILFKSYDTFQPAKDVVANIGTEFWVAVRCAVRSRQLFNIPESILQQFYSRQLETVANGTRYRIESKKAMRKRGLRSPNEADALSFVFDLLRNRGFKYAYYGEWKHKEIYGEGYFKERQQKSNVAQINQAGRLLGLGHNITKGVGWGRSKNNSKKRRKNRGNIIVPDAV